MTDLSPATQAVLSSYHASPLIKDNLLHRYCLAAALRATVQELKYFGITEKNILAIATELENSEATNYSANLRTARRPKPPSLKEQALKRLTEAELTLIVDPDGTIRRALEALPDD